MRRRTCAAVVLCGPLVAGCGTTARLDFRGQSRPATPVDVSVYLGGARPQIDPRQVSPGMVQFYIANQTRQPHAIGIVTPAGRTIARTPMIPAGGTGQLRADLTLAAYGVEYAGRSSSMELLRTRGRPRQGNDDLRQP